MPAGISEDNDTCLMRSGSFEGFFDGSKALLSPHFPAGQWWNFDLSSHREENRATVHSVLVWFLYHAVKFGKHPSPLIFCSQLSNVALDARFLPSRLD